MISLEGLKRLERGTNLKMSDNKITHYHLKVTIKKPMITLKMAFPA
jgi:hypothetical protein